MIIPLPCRKSGRRERRMMVVAVIQRQLVRNIVQFKLTPSDPVCNSPDCCAEIAPTMQVLIQCVIP